MFHQWVRERWGLRTSVLFASAVLGVGAFGIYLGRFVRLNSWDVLARPLKLLTDLAALGAPMKHAEVAAFTLVFFLFNVGAYWFIAAALGREDGPRGNGEAAGAKDVSRVDGVKV